MEESDDPKSNTQHFPKRIRTRRRADRNPARRRTGRLALIAIGLYLGSWIARNKAGTVRFADTIPVREQHEVLADVR